VTQNVRPDAEEPQAPVQSPSLAPTACSGGVDAGGHPVRGARTSASLLGLRLRSGCVSGEALGPSKSSFTLRPRSFSASRTKAGGVMFASAAGKAIARVQYRYVARGRGSWSHWRSWRRPAPRRANRPETMARPRAVRNAETSDRRQAQLIGVGRNRGWRVGLANLVRVRLTRWSVPVSQRLPCDKFETQSN
jgi:hypothetical protein